MAHVFGFGYPVVARELLFAVFVKACLLVSLPPLRFSSFAHEPAAPVFLLEKTARAGKEQSEAKAKEQQRWRC